MKQDLDHLIENYFAPSKEILNFESLCNLINEQIDIISQSGKIKELIQESLTKHLSPPASTNNPSQILLEETQETIIKFPKIKITEKWGEKHNEDREIFETMMRNVRGDTVREKLRYVAEFLEHKEGLPVAEILSNLMFVEIFSNILEEFNPSTAGFLFEAFLAGLFKGIQIADPEGGSLPIKDVEIVQLVQRAFGETEEIVPYSLKVLSPNTDLKGSFKNLVDHFRVPDESGKAPEQVVYLAVTKTGGTGPVGRLEFYEFEINKENFFDWVGHEHIDSQRILDIIDFTPGKEGTVDNNKLKFGNLDIGIKPEIGKITADGWQRRPTSGVARRKEYEDIPEEEQTIFKTSTLASADARESGPSGLAISLNGYRLSVGSYIYPDQIYQITVDTGQKEWIRTGKKTIGHKKLYGDAVTDWDLLMKNPKSFPGYANNEQWHISPRYYREMGNLIGELDLSKDKLYTVFKAYASNLGESLVDLYNSLANLSININKYFLDSNKSAGQQAIADATTVKGESEKLISRKGTKSKS